MFIVEKWMTKNVITVLPHEKIIDAFELMQGQGIRHLPVVENGELKGLVTDRDIRLALIPSPLSTSEDRVYHLGALELGPAPGRHNRDQHRAREQQQDHDGPCGLGLGLVPVGMHEDRVGHRG